MFLPSHSPQTRFPANAAASGSDSPLWYSQNVGPMHITFITSYAPYDQASAQYAWLESDLANVNRTETPWLIVVFHAPWYTSYRSHYMEVNCHRLDTETLLYENGVDLVLNGHVHAYERTFPVYNFTLDDCGPVHITVGDGGNVEKLAAVFADLPGNCPNISEYGPGYQPEVCPQYLYDGEFCDTTQPFWSAYRRVCVCVCWHCRGEVEKDGGVVEGRGGHVGQGNALPARCWANVVGSLRRPPERA